MTAQTMGVSSVAGRHVLSDCGRHTDDPCTRVSSGCGAITGPTARAAGAQRVKVPLLARLEIPQVAGPAVDPPAHVGFIRGPQVEARQSGTGDKPVALALVREGRDWHAHGRREDLSVESVPDQRIETTDHRFEEPGGDIGANGADRPRIRNARSYRLGERGATPCRLHAVVPRSDKQKMTAIPRVLRCQASMAATAALTWRSLPAA
jgi:hypothetical protein